MVKPSKSVESLDPYNPSSSASMTVQQKSNAAKFDWNELTIPPSPLVKKALIDAVNEENFNYYPDIECSDLRNKLQQYTGISTKNISVFSGSDSALRAIFDAYIETGDKVVAREPVYSQPSVFVQSNGGDYAPFVAEDPFSANPMEFQQKIDADIKVVYIPNPSNPTGVRLSSEEVEKLLHNNQKVLFIIDEAYYEFCNISVKELINKYDNILISRTFSKAFGLAGLRVGYLLGAETTLSPVRKVRNGKNVNYLAQEAASAALDDLEYLSVVVEEVQNAQKKVVEFLRKEGFQVQSTEANFILVKVSSPESVIANLDRNGIYVRNRSNLPKLDGYIRISIGTTEQMKEFLSAFSSLEDNILFLDTL